VEKRSVGRPKKADQSKRLSIAQEYLLKGFKDHEIVEEMAKLFPGYTTNMLVSDKETITANYIKAVTENKYLLAKQAETIMKHLDQLDMIKKKLWEIESKANGDTKGQIEALKTLLTELEHESKILKLIDTSHKIIKNYIHIDKINILMEKLTGVIREFVPEDKQPYAFQRIKDMGSVLDTECTEIADQVEAEEEKGR
jgi:hypothetical protein